MLASLIRVPLEDLVAGAELALPQPIFDQDYPAQQILDSESSQLPKSKRGFFQALLYRVGPGIVESMAEDVITNVDVDKRLLRFIGDWEQLSEPQKQLLVAMIEQFSPS